MAQYLRPFRESPPNRYSRLLPPARPSDDFAAQRCALSELAAAMLDDGTRVSEERPEILLEAGYTYFGQFMAHDLTKDVSTLDEVWRKEPADLQNFVTPKLDLDLIYGDGPAGSPELYEDGARLKVGAVTTRATSSDICTNARGQGVVADERTLANVILRQMTAVFARLHNFAVERFRRSVKDRQLLFRKAQRQTQWQFQWLVCKDYLPAVLDPAVYAKVFRQDHPAVRWREFSVPVEFSVAAMRFGHAMVRPNYLLSVGRETLLPQILGRTSDRGSLSEELAIDWGLFFQGAGGCSALTTRPIDTRVAHPLHDLPENLVAVAQIGCPHFKIDKNPAQLPLRTLLRGVGLRLASGQTGARGFGEPILSEDELTQNSRGEETEQGCILRSHNLVHETPLWYYILKESEVRENGNRLGPLGSHIVAETIYAALRHDRESILHATKIDAVPPIWHLPDGSERIFGLTQLFRVARLL